MEIGSLGCGPVDPSTIEPEAVRSEAAALGFTAVGRLSRPGAGRHRGLMRQ